MPNASESKTQLSVAPYSPTETALTVLLILLAAMTLAMFTRTQPHPPLLVAPFAMGPYLGASMALCAAALMLGAERTFAGRIACGLALIFALVAFGPQKWLDPAFPRIWPAVVLAQLAIATLALSCLRAIRARA